MQFEQKAGSSEAYPSTTGLVLHFRTVEGTADCLESLRESGLERVLLVDNSQDGGRSLEELRPRLYKLELHGLVVEVLEPGCNLGFAAGVNRGLAAIRQHFGRQRVLLINSDAQLLPGSMLSLQAAVDAGAAIATPLLAAPDGRLKSVTYYHRLSGLLTSFPLPGAFRHPSGCCLLFSESRAGADVFNERFFFYGEDAYLGWELACIGEPATVVESARALHFGSGSSRRGSVFYEYYMARAHLELARELAQNPADEAVMLVVRCASLPLRAIVRAARQGSLAPIRGLALASVDFVRRRTRDLTPQSAN